MRTVVLLSLLSLPAALQAQQGTDPTIPPESVRREILSLEERIGQANFDCDYKFFAEVEAKEFIFTGGRGDLTTREQDLAGEKECKPRKGSYLLEEVRMMSYGDVVVFNALATTKSTGASGEERKLIQRFTDVLVRRDGRWQLVAGHASRIP